MKKETYSAPSGLSKLFVLLTLLFSTSHVHPLCTHTFDPLQYIQGHKTESVYEKPVHTRNSDFSIDVNDQKVTTINVFSTQSTSSKETISSISCFSDQYCTPPLLISAAGKCHTWVSNNIQFIKHQSFSDDDPPLLSLI